MKDPEMDALVQTVGNEYLDCIELIARVLKPVLGGRTEHAAQQVLSSLARGGYVTVKTEKLEAMERRIEELDAVE